jgi:four helix bundle protein
MTLPHHKLVVWQRADDLFIDIHRATHRFFPREEKYELGSQIRRSAYSIPANIVEGNARQGVGEKLRFFNYASASLSETGYGLHAAHRLGYLTDDVYAGLVAQMNAVGAPLQGLIRKHRSARVAKGAVKASVV